jgi:hypothetical protein
MVHRNQRGWRMNRSAQVRDLSRTGKAMLTPEEHQLPSQANPTKAQPAISGLTPILKRNLDLFRLEKRLHCLSSIT